MEGPQSSKTKKSSKKLGEKPSKSIKPKLYSKPINPSSDPQQGEPKAKLRTSKDVFNRLKWDAASMDIDVSELYIGYKDRFLGMCEVKFTDFNPCAEDGDIPFHRIYYFRGGGPPVDPFVGKDGEVRVREDNWPPNTTIYWDRETRLDLIFNSGETFSNSQKHYKKNGNHIELIPAGYNVVPVYRFNPTAHAWQVSEDNDTSSIPTGDYKLLSFNILYELYDNHICHPGRRWPYLIDFLEESDADIIALQEVTPTFLSLLESAPWVQQNYFLSDISTVRRTIRPYGQVFLSKFQPCQLFHSEEFGKRFILAKFQTPQNPLYIANVHLKSNHKGDSSKLRLRQLQGLLQAYAQIDPKGTAEFLVVGDSNMTNGESIHALNSKIKMLDVWESLMEGTNDPGWTVNIHENGIAKQLCIKAEEERFDRIFKTINSPCFASKEIRVTGKSRIDLSRPPRASLSPLTFDPQPEPQDLWLSDHYALEFDFQILLPESSEFEFVAQAQHLTTGPPTRTDAKDSVDASMSPVHTSAVVIIPPANLWSRIQAVRAEFDPSFDRWPPHVNLIYGFIPDVEGNFSEAEARFVNRLKNETPFTVRLSKVDTFRHSPKSWTVYLTTSDGEEEERVTNLQLSVGGAYPACMWATEFKPHLTISKLSTDGDLNKGDMTGLVNEWSSSFLAEPIEFEVDRIHLISRRGNNSFRIRKTVFIGSRITQQQNHPSYLKNFLSANNLLPSHGRADKERIILTEVQELCERVTGEGEISTHLAGSTRMGFHDDSSDMDILICGPRGMSHESFFGALSSVHASTVGENPKLEMVSVVLDTLVPIARFRMGSMEIDLVYCPCGANNWGNISEEELRGQAESFVRSVDGMQEANALFQMIPQPWWSTYSTSVRALKFWATRRQIYSKVMGYLSSNTISLLLAKVILVEMGNGSGQPFTPEELVLEFFNFYSSWKWPTAVTFHDPYSSKQNLFPPKTPQLMPICSPSFPYLNRTRNVTKSTRMQIQREINRADRILSSIPTTFGEKWRALCEVEDFFQKYPLYIQIRVNSGSEEDLRVCDGILRSKFVNLLIGLEKPLGIFCQPCTQVFFPGNRTLVAFIGCETSPSRELTEAVLVFKTKLEKWTSGFVREKIRAEVTQVLREGPVLDGFRTPETHPVYDPEIETEKVPLKTCPDNPGVKCENSGKGGSWVSANSLKLTGIACLLFGTIIGIRRYYWK